MVSGRTGAAGCFFRGFGFCLRIRFYTHWCSGAPTLGPCFNWYFLLSGFSVSSLDDMLRKTFHMEGRFLITGPYCSTIGVNCSAACNTFCVLESILLSESGFFNVSKIPPPLLLEELWLVEAAGANKFGQVAFCFDLPSIFDNNPSFFAGGISCRCCWLNGPRKP